jgi:7-carboxy-7-deazaguanine synthase
MIRVHEVFKSIQGEGSMAGYPFAFIRLAGCNLRCAYCDTQDAWEGGTEESVIEVANRIADMGVPRVLVTGGEPLHQPDGRVLVDALVERGLKVFVETNGSIDLEGLNPRCRIVMDVKTPSSGEVEATNVMNLMWLKPGDEIKFVIGDRNDYEWARAFCVGRGLQNTHWTILFSPVYGKLPLRDLADWVLDDGLNVCVRPQLHKLIWPEGERRDRI